MAKSERVLIVGAGMAGLGLAIALRRQGVNPEIVERRATWPRHGAGIYLVGNAMRALRSLNLADQVLRQGSLIRTQTVLSARGRKLATIDTDSVWAWARCGPCVGVRRADLQGILQEPWAAGRVLLIGDAAHATSPNMASGAAMAFEDSLVLSTLIASGRGVAQVIDEYSAQRAPRVRWVHEQTHRRDKIRNLPPLIRDLMTRYLANAVYRANYQPLIAEL
jgi:2-polyprenyl-6-methoxyphenol hydroxylase-like FAD-dependent oxidoreductase